jgi:toxin-antitoxin system PIN domain toxin
MVRYLLDGNVLIAVSDNAHVHHEVAARWFVHHGKYAFATCPITQGTLLRLLLRNHVASHIEGAVRILHEFIKHPAHRFWKDELSYETIRWTGVLGHRQVTDAYLASLARKHKGRVATLDQGLAALHNDVAELIPV